METESEYKWTSFIQTKGWSITRPTYSTRGQKRGRSDILTLKGDEPSEPLK